MTRLTIRFDFGSQHRIGPGKVALLEAIDRTGSITTAARSLGMSYRRAWVLIEDVNAIFTEPVVETTHGGAGGGGASLTPLGAEVVARYRRTESRLHTVARNDLKYLERRLANVTS
jgi:molybdate transport system regulatory protein